MSAGTVDLVRHPEVEVVLPSAGSNGFVVVGRVRAAMRRAGISNEEIEAFSKEAASGDYEAVAARWVRVS